MPTSQSELKLAKERAKELGVPFVDLSSRQVSTVALREISEEAATFYQLVPIDKKGGILEVGMINPDDIKAQEALRFIAQNRNFTPKVFLIAESDFRNVLKQYRTLKEEVETALTELDKELSIKEPEEKRTEKIKVGEVLERVMAEAPITKIVAVILRHAQEGRASDVHIEPTEDKLKIRFRVDGILYTSLLLPKSIHPAVVSRIKILSNLKIDETRVPQDGRFHSVIDDKKIDFRVATFPTSFGEKVVLRLLDPTAGVMDFEQLGLLSYNRRTLEKAIREPFGMILLTGPTGSGKTTTLYAIMHILNQEAVNVVSLEDPIEYYIEGVSQSQVKPEIGYTFASGLRSILRQDPDIIMVGEIRDNETADLATHSALTGHIVLSTLHTNDAVGVIPRLIDMGVQNFLLAPALGLAMSQRLVRRLCPECKKPVTPPAKVKEMIQKDLQTLPKHALEELKDVDLKDIKIWEAPGCKFCGKKGTKGRISLNEALLMTNELQAIVQEGFDEIKVKGEMARQGVVTIRQDGIVKVLKGIISFRELLDAVEIDREFADEVLDDKAVCIVKP